MRSNFPSPIAHRFVVPGARQPARRATIIHSSSSSARGGRERKTMSVVAASTFAPFSARVRSAIPARSRRASPSSTRRPVATARAEADAEGEGSTSSTRPRTAGRRAGLAAGAGLALAAAAFPARAIGGAAVGLPDVVELTPDNFAKQVRRSTRAIRTPLSI